jgi:hypothetical protein
MRARTGDNDMSRIIYIALGSLTLGALSACDREPRPQTETTIAEDAQATLEEARNHEAEKYAPSHYSAAVEALERGDSGETGSAEALARRAMDEAVRVREEAKQAAHEQLRTARTLLMVVEAVLSHDPPNRSSLPADTRMAELREELDRAQDAYAAGDFAVAGLIAQGVASELTGAPRIET